MTKQKSVALEPSAICNDLKGIIAAYLESHGITDKDLYYDLEFALRKGEGNLDIRRITNIISDNVLLCFLDFQYRVGEQLEQRLNFQPELSTKKH